MGIPTTNIRFHYACEVIDDDKTLKALELEDEDVIEVYQAGSSIEKITR